MRSSDEILKTAIKEQVKRLKNKRLKNLSQSDKNALIDAVLYVISNYKKFDTAVYALLIPLCVVAVENRKQLQSVKQQLSKRNIKQLFPGNINPKLVSTIQLELNDDTKQSPFQEHSEYYIALFELQKCRNNEKKAQLVLKTGFEKLKKSKPANFVSFLEYALEQSEGHPEDEWFFVKQIIAFSPQIPLYILNKMNELLPEEKKRRAETDQLIKQLKIDNKDNYFDKIADMLFHQDRLEELVEEIAKQKNKFWLLNKVVLKMLPETSVKVMETFATHFGNAITEARETHYQEYIFNYSKKYLQKLKPAERKRLTEMMIEKTSKHSYIRNFILNTEPL